MSITELLSQIYNEADRKGINLEKFGIHDDDDLIIKALTLLSNDLEDVFYDNDVENMDEGVEDEDELPEWLEDITEDEFDRIVGIRQDY